MNDSTPTTSAANPVGAAKASVAGKPVMASVPCDAVIRRAEMRDAATIAVFNLRMAFETERLRLNPTTLDRGVRAVFEDPRRGTYYVAECDGFIVGCVMITHEWSDWRNGDVWWFQSVYVDIDHRRRGIFRAMHAHVSALAKEAGVVALRLYHDKHNSRARETYLALGFEATDYDVMHKPL